MTHMFRRIVHAAAGVGLLVTTGWVLAGTSPADQVAALLKHKYPSLQQVIVTTTPASGLYRTTIAGQTAYTDAKADFLIVGGDLLVEKNGTMTPWAPADDHSSDSPAATPLQSKDSPPPAGPTAASMPSPHGQTPVVSKMSDAYDKLPFNWSVPIVYGNGERRLAMFIDPDCPYCQNMEYVLAQKGAALNATIFLFPWALTVHPYGEMMTRYLWCAPDRAQAWESWMVFAGGAHMINPKADDLDLWKAWLKKENRPATLSCKASPIDAVRTLAHQYNFNYTPTLLFENGATVNGEIDPKQLERVWNYVYHGVVPRY